MGHVLEVPQKLEFLFIPKRYKVAYGGRGGAKSWAFARVLLFLGTQKKMLILCARELQVSISDSVHRLLSNQIESLGLQDFYTIQNNSIIGKNGTEFLFSGLKNNITKIKSMEGLDIVWIEEAEKVSHASWETLIPTLRKKGSEIWVSFNPNEPTDPTYIRFVKNPPDDSIVVHINWQDNPWFPEELRKEKDYLYRVDADAAHHIWGGTCRKASDAQVLRGKISIESFTPIPGLWDGPYQGVDWGFSTDPSVLTRCWVWERCLYVEYEAYGVGVETDHLSALFDLIPDARNYITRADNARPETISFMVRAKWTKMIAVDKWKGSVEDGVAFLRSFDRIVIHPRCKHAEEEGRLWSYKVDRLSGDVLPELIDKHNHVYDSIRYALTPLIRGWKATSAPEPEPDPDDFMGSGRGHYGGADAWMNC